MESRYKIGMRNIKTAVAVGICLLTVQLIGLFSSVIGLDKEINGIQAALAATICMKSSLQTTLKTGLDRTIGTIIGSVMGVLFLLLGGYIPSALFVLLVTAGVVVIIYMCNVLRLQASIPISVVVYLIILVGRRETSPLMYGLVRFVETMFGIFVAYVVNRFLDIRRIARRGKEAEADTESATLRAFTPADTGTLMHIWLRAHISSHSFTSDMVWHQRYESVRSALSSSDTVIYHDDGGVKGFICVTEDVITALCTLPEARGRGGGTRLLDRAKETHACLSIRVFKKNESAVKFLLNRGFVIAKELPASPDSEAEYVMEWSLKNKAACPVPSVQDNEAELSKN